MKCSPEFVSLLILFSQLYYIMSEISNDEIRYKILEILYKVALKGGPNWQVKRSYLKNHLSVDESLVDFNVFYLADRDLARIIKRSGNWETVVITGEGIDVYEHKLDFASQYPFIKIAIQNIDGPVYGSAVQAVDSKLSINQRITDSFKQAYSLIELQSDLSSGEKKEIKKNLKGLEEEVKAEKPDKNKLQRLWDWVKANANWVVPTLKEIIEDILKTLGSS